MITIKRACNYHCDVKRAYKIYIDGEFIDTINNSETKSFNLSKGNHCIQLKIDYCTSKKITFNYSELDKDVTFLCDSNVKGFKFLLILLYISILRSQYLTLKRIN